MSEKCQGSSKCVPDADPTRYPFGECECRVGCQCQWSAGPAAFRIRRGDKEMRVCTRCDLSKDERLETLVKDEKDLCLFFRYDPLGGGCLKLRLRSGDKELT